MNGLEELRAFMAQGQRAPIAERLEFDLIAFTEAKLLDRDGRLCASATSTLLVFDK